jgi:hypothetical protein
MRAKDLSILIPSRCEEFLSRTIEDIVANIEADTEVIAVLDGEWSNPPIEDGGNVNIIYLPVSIGQRAATNLACRMSRAKYVMKVDAHVSFDKGFDRKLIEDMQDDWTVVPTMRNLHCFDWVCECGIKRYQDTGKKCTCGKDAKKEMIWKPRRGTKNYSYCFDAEPHFQYFSDYRRRKEFIDGGDLTETMSLQGSCFMMTREKYWELDICDESFGSWGSQGIEVAVKTWLSGGKVMCNHKTWYAHMFRTKQVNGFGFPYPQSGKQIQEAKSKARDIFFNNRWDKAIHPLSWLIERFMPIPGWTQEDLDKLKKVV